MKGFLEKKEQREKEAETDTHLGGTEKKRIYKKKKKKRDTHTR